MPRTPSVPNRRGMVDSTFATGDSHLYRRGLDAHDARVLGQLGVDGQRVLAGPDSGQLDIGENFLAGRAVQCLTAAPQRDVHRGGARFRPESRTEIAEAQGTMAQ